MPQFASITSKLVLLLVIVSLAYWSIVISLMIGSVVSWYPVKDVGRLTKMLNSQGLRLLYSGKENESIPYFDKALAINPIDVSTLTNKGLALVFLKKPNQSIVYFDKALAINPNDVNALTSKGLAVGALGDYNESISYFDKALAINPKFNVAIQHKQQFVAAIAKSANATALTNKGIALLNLGKYAESLPYFNKALSIAGSLQPVLEPVYTFALAGKKLVFTALSHKGVALLESGKVNEFDALANSPRMVLPIVKGSRNEAVVNRY